MHPLLAMSGHRVWAPLQLLEDMGYGSSEQVNVEKLWGKPSELEY